MIIVKAPLRMSYVGGGSDLPSYYTKYGGAVISAAIKKYIYIMVKPRFEDGVRLSYSKTENVENHTKLEHPIVKNALDHMKISENIEIVSMADIPSYGSGLGSSSTFSVALIMALSAFKGNIISDEEAAKQACHLEINLCGSPIGKQDQYASAFGGLRVYRFHKNDTVSSELVSCRKTTIEKLNFETSVFYIGGKRDANSILERQSQALNETRKAKLMSEMVSLVDELKQELENDSTANFGKILNENWQLKRELSGSISSPYIDEIYSEAMSVGVTGGKLLGAGGGGFMIFHTPDNATKNRLSKKLYKLKELSFSIESTGASIIYNKKN